MDKMDFEALTLLIRMVLLFMIYIIQWRARLYCVAAIPQLGNQECHSMKWLNRRKSRGYD